MKKILVALVLFTSHTFLLAQENQKVVTAEEIIKSDAKDITFKSQDGLEVSAKLYEIDKNAPVIILCHQARYNKFEYNSIALKLNKKGFNCFAIDQRSGGDMKSANGTLFSNDTYNKAQSLNKPTNFVDAEQDIIATINYVKSKYKTPLVLWGSSYSSALALYIGAENKNVDAVVSFSPGDYLANDKGSLVDVLDTFKKPMFLTSSKAEIRFVEQLLSKATLGTSQVHFKPEGKGHHGSRALWVNQLGGEEYWEAINDYLNKIKALFPLIVISLKSKSPLF